MRTVPVKRPRTFERKPPSASTPAVIPSDPGTSYNPTYEAHQNLLKRAVDVEVVKEREKEAVAKRMEYPAELDLLDPDHEIAMIEDGEDEEEEVQRMDQDDDDDDDDAGAAPRAPRPLTQAERNKKKRRLELSKQEEEQRLRKKQAREISNLGTLLKEVKKKSRFDAPIRPVPQTEADPKRLGPHKFKEAPIEVNLTEELSESLRSIKVGPTLGLLNCAAC